MNSHSNSKSTLLRLTVVAYGLIYFYSFILMSFLTVLSNPDESSMDMMEMVTILIIRVDWCGNGSHTCFTHVDSGSFFIRQLAKEELWRIRLRSWKVGNCIKNLFNELRSPLFFNNHFWNHSYQWRNLYWWRNILVNDTKLSIFSGVKYACPYSSVYRRHAVFV